MSATPQYLFPPGPYDAALEKALSDAESVAVLLRDAREAAAELEIRAEELSRLISSLISALPRERRALYAERAGALRGQPARPARSSATFENVIGLFADQRRKEWTAPDVRQALTDRGTPAEPDQVSNVLHYLARKGRLKRISRGRYVLVDYGAGIEGDPDGGYE